MPRYIDATLLKAEFTGNFIDTSYSPEFIKAIIDGQPTADVQEVRHAKFELVNNGKGVCSNCHRLDSIDNLAKYCRYCGARMDGDKK